MPKLQGLGVILVGIILSLTTNFAQLSFGQIPTLDKLNLEGNLSPQCLDFNQDGICEYMLLANGTMVKNPDISSSSGSSAGSPNLNSFVAGLPQQTSQTYGKCMGFGYNYCKNLLMPNGSMVPNPNFVEPTYEELGIGSGSQVQTQTVEDEEGNDKKSGDDCWDDGEFIGKDKCDTHGLPICSEVSDGRACFDDLDSPQPDDEDDKGYTTREYEGEDWSGEGYYWDEEVEDEEPEYEVEEGYEDDGYIDENNDGNYDEGEE